VTSLIGDGAGRIANTAQGVLVAVALFFWPVARSR